MQMLRCLYLARSWREDESRMRRAVRHLSSVYGSRDDDCGSPFQLLLFPEGTDLTEGTRAKSDAYADANGKGRLK